MSDEVKIRLTEDGPIRYRGGGKSFDRGEEKPTNADHAEHLTETFDYFEKVVETCQVEKSNGEICGRELPCAYHSDEDDGDSEGSDE